MSHELRTPMNAILGFGQVLVSDPRNPLNEAQSHRTQYILDAGYHLLDLINGMLDLSRIEMGDMNLNVELVDIRAVLDECLEMIAANASDKKVSVFDGTAGANVPRLHVDRTRLKQILLNLLSNAVKYNRPGGSVTLSCARKDDETLRLSVADTGMGIPKHQWTEIFEPFARPVAETQEVEGIGIGLTIAKQMTELMGGRIDFESKPGTGSTFWVDLPMVLTSEARSKLPQTS